MGKIKGWRKIGKDEWYLDGVGIELILFRDSKYTDVVTSKPVGIYNFTKPPKEKWIVLNNYQPSNSDKFEVAIVNKEFKTKKEAFNYVVKYMQMNTQEKYLKHRLKQNKMRSH